MILIVQIVLMFWSFFMIFLHCNFGEIITNAFSDINEQLYQCDWYTFPLDIQRMQATILINTERPILLKGFGNILSTRDTFKRVNLQIYIRNIFKIMSKNDNTGNNVFRWCIEDIHSL